MPHLLGELAQDPGRDSLAFKCIWVMRDLMRFRADRAAMILDPARFHDAVTCSVHGGLQ